MPLAGFFCAREVGPVGGLNFLRTFTTSIPLSRAARLAARE
jgi:small ligand-binding sensory domain FIST